jgi:tetratricopeptide (TPR) repeat protein
LQPKWKQTQSKESLVQKALELIESAPKFWESYRVLGEIYSQLGEIERSIEYHERAIAVCPIDRELSRSRAHYFLALKLYEVDDERAMAESYKAVELHECLNTLVNYARSLIYIGKFAEAESTLDRAMEFTENPSEVFYVDKFKLDCLRRKCVGLLGLELLLGAMATLRFCLQSVALRWDCPRDKRSAIEDGVSEALVYLCEGYVAVMNTRNDVREDVVEVLLRIDSMMSNWGIVDWPMLLEKGRRKGLRNLEKIIASEPELMHRLGEKVKESIEFYGFGSLATVNGTLKVWRTDLGFGFVMLKFDELNIEAYFQRRDLRRSEDEAKMAFRKTPSISGELHKHSDSGKYYLSNVEVD